WILIVLPMIVATVSVVSALGLMIAFGYPVHILSSMLPIFLMPIAICDSVHILSDFFESYTREKGRERTVKEVMGRLFAPLLYTSLTTAAGFLSFLTTSIPPARVFGVFVAIGVMIAWGATVLLVPAYVMMIPERVLDNFGRAAGDTERHTRLARFLQAMGRFACRYAKPVLGVMLLLIVIAVWGISRINVNDNYAKRFTVNHPIRKADTALNKHFGGTYTAYLVLEGTGSEKPSRREIARIDSEIAAFSERTGERVARIVGDVRSMLPTFAEHGGTYEKFMDAAIRYVEEKTSTASDDDSYVLEELKGYFTAEKEGLKTFKRPEVLRYMVGLQEHLEQAGIVGKTTSVADVVRKVNQELMDGKKENFRIPDKPRGISECCLQYQQSHRPHDLWHLITPDFEKGTIMMQFTRGDSSQTQKAVDAVESYLESNPPPVELSYRWTGLHYVNLVFQGIMFRQMLGSFLGAFVIVFFMVAVLFRSFIWAGACMIPLTLTIAAIYGVTGIIGKDYDMPVAVMSAITLGIAVDFAIHFLERSRRMYRETGSWKETAPKVFGEPALAIARNVLVVALGFLPLMVARLIPYKTTSILLFGILTTSGVVTLLFLPALLTVAEKRFFGKEPVEERLADRSEKMSNEVRQNS
ncbi:MAG TPA: MMPL family transporter, partial [Geobacteraceae bacterium]|nr:MMPL family transporter [Geobacteraceae bacterium]